MVWISPLIGSTWICGRGLLALLKPWYITVSFIDNHSLCPEIICAVQILLTFKSSTMASVQQGICDACISSVDLLIRSKACRHLLCQTCAGLPDCPACKCNGCDASEVTTRGQCPHGLCTNCFVTLGLDGDQSSCQVCQEVITGLYVSI